MKQMKYFLGWLLVLLVGVGVVGAQDATGTLTYSINVRETPSTSGRILTQLNFGTVVVIEGRNNDSTWLLARTQDGGARGWMSRQYIDVGVLDLNTLPVLDGQTVAPAAPQEAPAAPAQVAPSGGATATIQGVNLIVRMSPSTRSGKLGVLAAGTTVSLVGRSERSDWAFVTDGAITGWVLRRYLRMGAGVDFAALPVATNNGQAAPVAAAGGTAPVVANQEPVAAASASTNYIVVNDTIINRARATFQLGQSLGNNPNTFIKIGDSNMNWTEYLCPLNSGSYDLGSYGYLKGVVDTFASTNSFCQNNATSHEGFTSAAILDAYFVLNPECRADEIPLTCEVRLRRPSYALIYVGVLDMNYLPAEAYQQNLTNMASYLTEHGVVPIFFTFTIDDWRHDGRAAFYNDAVRRVAQRFQVPLVDVQQALFNYPKRGTADDGFHLATRDRGFISFTGDENVYGRTKRELLTLEVLNQIHWRISQ